MVGVLARSSSSESAINAPAPIESRARTIAPTIKAFRLLRSFMVAPWVSAGHDTGPARVGGQPVVLAIETPGSVRLGTADVELRAVREGETEREPPLPVPLLPPRPHELHGLLRSAPGRSRAALSSARPPATKRISSSGSRPYQRPITGGHRRNTMPTIARDPSTSSRGIIGIASAAATTLARL